MKAFLHVLGIGCIWKSYLALLAKELQCILYCSPSRVPNVTDWCREHILYTCSFAKRTAIQVKGHLCTCLFGPGLQSI